MTLKRRNAARFTRCETYDHLDVWVPVLAKQMWTLLTFVVHLCATVT